MLVKGSTVWYLVLSSGPGFSFVDPLVLSHVLKYLLCTDTSQFLFWGSSVCKICIGSSAECAQCTLDLPPQTALFSFSSVLVSVFSDLRLDTRALLLSPSFFTQLASKFSHLSELLSQYAQESDQSSKLMPIVLVKSPACPLRCANSVILAPSHSLYRPLLHGPASET